ncbi:MAG: hypothetical protein AAF517_09760, partial [Planctomycetota bacterium]
MDPALAAVLRDLHDEELETARGALARLVEMEVETPDVAEVYFRGIESGHEEIRLACAERSLQLSDPAEKALVRIASLADFDDYNVGGQRSHLILAALGRLVQEHRSSPEAAKVFISVLEGKHIRHRRFVLHELVRGYSKKEGLTPELRNAQPPAAASASSRQCRLKTGRQRRFGIDQFRRGERGWQC